MCLIKKLSAVSSQLSAISYEISVISFQLPASRKRDVFTTHDSRLTIHDSRFTSHVFAHCSLYSHLRSEGSFFSSSEFNDLLPRWGNAYFLITTQDSWLTSAPCPMPYALRSLVLIMRMCLILGHQFLLDLRRHLLVVSKLHGEFGFSLCQRSQRR